MIPQERKPSPVRHSSKSLQSNTAFPDSIMSMALHVREFMEYTMKSMTIGALLLDFSDESIKPVLNRSLISRPR